MPEWIYFIHPPRDDFAATMTDDEKSVWAEHFDRLQRLLAAGQLILAGPTLGRINTGVAVFEAPDEDAARQIMAADPAISSGYARGELRPFRIWSRGGPRRPPAVASIVPPRVTSRQCSRWTSAPGEPEPLDERSGSARCIGCAWTRTMHRADAPPRGSGVPREQGRPG